MNEGVYSIKEKQLREIMSSLKKYDKYTYEHSLRVAKLSLIMGEQLHFNTDECNQIYLAGLLHDIGKIEIPIDIINKSGELSKEEYRIIKEHPMKGYNIMKKYNIDASVLNGILSHHERLNGEGYPFNLKGPDISLQARILGVVDSFDAMTSERTYNEKMTYDESLRILLNNTELYDEKIVNLLSDCYERGNKLCQRITMQ